MGGSVVGRWENMNGSAQRSWLCSALFTLSFKTNLMIKEKPQT